MYRSQYHWAVVLNFYAADIRENVMMDQGRNDHLSFDDLLDEQIRFHK